MTDHLCRVAEELRELYVGYRQRNQPRYQLPQADFKFFDKAAALCLEMKLEPYEYFAGLLSQPMVHSKGVLYTTMMAPPGFKTWYQGKEERNPAPDLDMMLTAYKRLLEVQLTVRKRGLEKTLLDDEVAFPPWFRVCCTKEPIASVWEKYGQAYKAQLTEDLHQFIESKGMPVWQ